MPDVYCLALWRWRTCGALLRFYITRKHKGILHTIIAVIYYCGMTSKLLLFCVQFLGDLTVFHNILGDQGAVYHHEESLPSSTKNPWTKLCGESMFFLFFFFLFIKTTLTLVTELSESVIECRLSRRDENCAFFSGKNLFSVTLNHREKYFIKYNSNNHAPQTPSWILSISCLSKQLQSVSF